MFHYSSHATHGLLSHIFYLSTLFSLIYYFYTVWKRKEFAFLLAKAYLLQIFDEKNQSDPFYNITEYVLKSISSYNLYLSKSLNISINIHSKDILEKYPNHEERIEFAQNLLEEFEYNNEEFEYNNEQMGHVIKPFLYLRSKFTDSIIQTDLDKIKRFYHFKEKMIFGVSVVGRVGVSVVGVGGVVYGDVGDIINAVGVM